MKKFIKKFVFSAILSISIFKVEQIGALVPHYYLPTQSNLKKESIEIGKYAYQLTYFGQVKDGLNLAKLAIKINKVDERLWLILSEAQIANNQYDDALNSLNEAQKLNPTISEIYFAKSSIYLKKSNLEKAKFALYKGLEIKPDNYKAMFQLGNIFLMEKNFLSAIKQFEKAVTIKPDFWQALNNQGLAYFEKGNINLSQTFFKKAISIEENAEPLLALAACLINKDTNKAISLAKKALIADPNYVNSKYRKEQLWGEKIQTSIEKLFKNTELKEEIKLAKLKINNPN